MSDPFKRNMHLNIDSFESDFLRVLNRVHATIARNEMRLAEKDRREAANLEWQQVTLAVLFLPYKTVPQSKRFK